MLWLIQSFLLNPFNLIASILLPDEWLLSISTINSFLI